MNTSLQIIPFLTILYISYKIREMTQGFLSNINSTMEMLLVKTEKKTVDEKMDK